MSLGATADITSGIVVHFANNVYWLNTKQEVVEYYHTAAGWPVKKTWISAIKCNAYAYWPGLTDKLIRCHLTVGEPTTSGHMNAF